MKKDKLDYLLNKAIAEAKTHKRNRRLMYESEDWEDNLLVDDDLNEELIDLNLEDWDINEDFMDEDFMDEDFMDNLESDDIDNFSENIIDGFDWDNYLVEDEDLENVFADNEDIIMDEDKLEKKSLSEQIKQELVNAYKVIEETNKINTQLLHALKILYEYDLPKSEKDKIISELSKTNSIEETKRKYKKLLENYQSEKKYRGMASKPINSTKPIIENSDPMVERMKKLAGII